MLTEIQMIRSQGSIRFRTSPLLIILGEVPVQYPYSTLILEDHPNI